MLQVHADKDSLKDVFFLTGNDSPFSKSRP